MLTADLHDWHEARDAGLGAVLNVTHACLDHLVRAAQTGARGVADIVTINPGRSAAVGAFSQVLRKDLGERHVRAGVIECGSPVSELVTTEEGLLDPQDVADAVVYMLTRPRHVTVNELSIRPTD